MSSQSEEKHKGVTNTIRQCMQATWTRENIPYGLKAALEKVKQSEPSSTERIFLGEGFAVWVAYYLALSGHGHYEGLSSRAKALANFHGLSIEDRREAAKIISKTNPHPSFQDALAKMLSRPDIRPYVLDQESSLIRSVSPKLISTTLNLPTSVNLFTSEGNLSPLASAPASPSNPNPSASLHCDSTAFNPSASFPSSANLDPSLQHVFSHASPLKIINVSPDYVAGAIGRDDIIRRDDIEIYQWNAAVTMTFSVDWTVDCHMGIAIVEFKVQHVAMALFNVHVEVDSDAQARQIVAQNGIKLVPSTKISLVGAHDEAILELFGLKILEAIEASQIYQKERQRGIRPTRCVSMLIPSSAST
ncbi:hypothetical protein MMC17_009790 [Xylographa soralifera]|nr:hypothetical protein [Xylographa soralifera]